jgi:hypothetical protein
MTVERIEFSLVRGDEGLFPPPYPANKEIPDWFKQMPVDAPGVPSGTVKNCPPFIEAMTCGYIIPLAADLKLSVDRAGVFQSHVAADFGTSGYFDILTPHNAMQTKGAPFGNVPVMKVFNPWLIRTPPGYSTLFMQPVNRFQMLFFPLAGLVETDLFYREVNFPCVLAIQRGSTLEIPKGTPLVQAIPIKRDEFQSEFVPLDKDKYATGRATTLPENHGLYPESEGFYKNNYWRKKTYH